jgi:hypothetical protein
LKDPVLIGHPAGLLTVILKPFAGNVPLNVGFLAPLTLNEIGVPATIVFVAVDVINDGEIFTVAHAVVLVDKAVAAGVLDAILANYGGNVIEIALPAGIV